MIIFQKKILKKLSFYFFFELFAQKIYWFIYYSTTQIFKLRKAIYWVQ